MNQTEQILLDAIKHSLFGTEVYCPNEADWDAVLKEANYQAVVGIAARGVPSDIQAKWQMYLYKVVAGNVQNTYAQSELCQLLKDHDIPVVILKGTAASIYYPEPSLRSLGDIDFYVAPDKLAQARAVLEANGYTPAGEGDARHLPYTKDGTAYELHHRFSYDDLDIEDHIEKGVACAEIKSVDGQEFPMLPPLANGLVLLAHMRHHLKSGLGFRQIIDWMMYCHKVLDDAFWEKHFLPACKYYGLDTLAITVTRMCQQYMGLPEDITWCRQADSVTCRILMENLLSSGNFGVKNSQGVPFEAVSTAFKSEGFFRYLQRSGEIAWQTYHKHRWLKPFCWIYQICRYAALLLKSKRGIKILKDIDRSSDRAELLKQLGI